MFDLIILSSAGKVIDFSNADVAVDQYHRFDVLSVESSC